MVENSVGFYKGVVLCIHYYSIIEKCFNAPNNSLYFSHSFLLPYKALLTVNPHLFPDYVVLSITECHINGILPTTSSSDLLLLLSNLKSV